MASAAAERIDSLRGGNATRKGMALVVGAVVLAAAAVALTPIATKGLRLPFGLYAAIGAAFVCARRPAGSIILIYLITTTLGTTLAYTGINLGSLSDLILAGLWLSLLIRFVGNRRHPERALWPAVVACLGYIAISFIEIFTANSTSDGLLSFRTSTWYILAAFLVAYAGWPELTYRRIARGLIVVTTIVAAYAVLRWQIGPSTLEAVRAQYAAAGINIVNGTLRPVGSFTTGHELAMWTGYMAPFTLAFGMANRGRWRLLGFLATILCIFGLLASEARGPLVGLVVGVVVVLALFTVARSFTQIRVAVVACAIAGTIAAGGIAFALTAGSSGTITRYTDIFHPTNDQGYAVRQEKWSQALIDISHHPLGQGLGTAGFIKERSTTDLTVASLDLDSSYLKIAYEQGFAVMVFFLAGWLALGGRLAWAAVSTRDPFAAAMGIGAVGTLVSVLITFYSGLYIESLPVMGAWLVVGLGLARFLTRPVDELPDVARGD